MSGNFTTSTEDMDLAAKHVMTVNEQVQGELKALQARLAPLAGAWTGDASMAFTRLMERWNTDATSLNNALNSIGGAIQSSGTSYARNEEQASSSMSSISAALNP